MSPPPPVRESSAAHFATAPLFFIHTTAEILPLLQAVVTAMGREDYPAADIFAVRLALEESLVNALKHGHGFDPSKTVRVRFQVGAEEVRAEVEDEGPGFDPDEVPDPCDPENLERSCGRGLLLIRHYMTSACYEGRGNRVSLCKCRSHD